MKSACVRLNWRLTLLLTAAVYIFQLVSFILIGVAAYGRVAAMVTSLTLVGSLIACGVFLFIISLIGLIGAAKHHQVLLFFVSFKTCLLSISFLVKHCCFISSYSLLFSPFLK